MIIPEPRIPPQAAASTQAVAAVDEAPAATQAAPEPEPVKADKPEGLLRNVLGALSGND